MWHRAESLGCCLVAKVFARMNWTEWNHRESIQKLPVNDMNDYCSCQFYLAARHVRHDDDDDDAAGLQLLSFPSPKGASLGLVLANCMWVWSRGSFKLRALRKLQFNRLAWRILRQRGVTRVGPGGQSIRPARCQDSHAAAPAPAPEAASSQGDRAAILSVEA